MSIFRNSRGFSIVGVTVAAAGAAAFALGFATMVGNQGKAVKGLIVKIEVQNIHNTIAEIMRDQTNCTATMMAASPTPPTMNEPIRMDSIYLRRRVNGVMESVPFYSVNRLYDNTIKITEMLIRPNIPTDETPGAKLVIKYEINAKIVGASSFTKKLELFTSNSAMPDFPDYAFRCGVSGAAAAPQISLEGTVNATRSVTNADCGANDFRTGNVICPDGKFPVSCGVQDFGANDSEDVPGCWVNPTVRGCTYAIDKDGNCDTFTVHCTCF